MGTVLVVRHGPGRGRLPRYLDQVLCAIGGDVRLHDTGSPAPDLQGCSAVVFWLGDPLRELYPDCYADSVRIADAARARGLRIVNPPEALSNSIKSRQSVLWRDAGIPTVAQQRYESRAELENLLATAEYPLLIRNDERHAQRGLRVLRRARDVPAKLSLPGTLAPLIDTRAPGERLYHKKRVLVMGDVVRTVHAFFSTSPIVSQRSSTFFHQERPLRHGVANLLLFRHRAGCLKADYDFCARETAHADLMKRSVRALGLDFAAIDYSDCADGTPILWEANPHFDLPPWYANVLPRERRLEERHPGLHAAFATFFASLRRDGGHDPA